jgi:hypothetical protein
MMQKIVHSLSFFLTSYYFLHLGHAPYHWIWWTIGFSNAYKIIYIEIFSLLFIEH